MNENAIVKLADKVKAIENLERQDLANNDTVRGIVRTAHEIKREAAAIAEQDKALKKRVKELCGEEIAKLGEKQYVTMYDVANEQKVYINVVGRGQLDVNADLLLDALYAHFNEEKGIKQGSKAWEIWQKVAVPKWEINQDALANLVAQNNDLGVVVGLAATPKREIVKFNAVSMTAAEKKAAKAGEIHDGLVVG